MNSLNLIQGVLGIIVSFGLIVILITRRVHYGFALTIGAVILGFFFELTPFKLWETAIFTLTDKVTIELAVIIGLIPIFAKFLEDSKVMEEFIEGLKGVFSSRTVIAAIPAVFGLLPMMGGALLSAPFIDNEAEKLGLSAEEKSSINVWFRHPWFFVSPLSPTLLIIAGLTGINLYSIILFNLPVFISYILLGYLAMLRPIRKVHGRLSDKRGAVAMIIKGSSPIVLTILTNILGVPLPISIILGIILTFILGRLNWKSTLSTIKNGFKWELVAAVLGVMYFRYVVKFGGVDSFIIQQAESLGIPSIVFLTAIPLMFGIITASPSASVVMSTPLAMSIYGGLLTPNQVSMLYISTVVSYNLSPLHLCLVLTVSYFKPNLHDVYKRLVPLFIIVYIIELIVGLSVNYLM